MDAATCSLPGGVCTSDSTSLEDLAIYGATAAVVMGLSTIVAMQLDSVSRWFLSPKSLLAKRRREYRYAVEQGNEYTALMIRQHIGGGKGVYDPKTEAVVWAKIGNNDTEEMDDLLTEIMDSKKATPVIVAIEQDLEDDKNPNEYHLFLAFPPASAGLSTPAAPNLYQKVRVPLIAFCERLAKAFKDKMTSTALCFVADASSGMGTELLTDVVKDANHGVVSCLILKSLDYFATLVTKESTTYISTHTGDNTKSCLDDNPCTDRIEQYSKYHHPTIRNYNLRTCPFGSFSCKGIYRCEPYRSIHIAWTSMCSTPATIDPKSVCP